MIVLNEQSMAPSSQRSTNSALLLTAAAPWFLNGLHSTPDNGSCSRDLIRKILPLVGRDQVDMDCLLYPVHIGTQTGQDEEDDDEDEEMEGEDEEDANRNRRENNISAESDASDRVLVNPRTLPNNNQWDKVPCIRHGIVFLREIYMFPSKAPRFKDRTVPMVTDKTFYFIFATHRANVDHEYFKAQLSLLTTSRRVPNKTRRTAIRAPKVDEPPKLFSVASRIARVLPEPVEISDAEDMPTQNELLLSGDHDNVLTNLWRQSLLDITDRVPNRRGASNETYCVLDKNERAAVDEITYQNLRLREFFDDCQYRTATESEWSAVFDRIWPEVPVLPVKAQNYRQMRYYVAWTDFVLLLTRNGHDEQKTALKMARAVLRKKFNDTFYWVPYAQTERLWYTKADGAKSQRIRAEDANKAAPRILIRAGRVAIV